MNLNIVNIAISPTGIGGTETFSRILNTIYPNSTTYSYSNSNSETYNVTHKIIKRFQFKRFLSIITLYKYSISNSFNYDFITDNTVIIINAPCDFDRIPLKVIIKYRVILLLHNEPNHIWNHRNYFGSNRENRLKALKYVNQFISLSSEYIPKFSKLFKTPTSKFKAVTHTVELKPIHNHKKLQKTIITICRIENKQKRLDRFIDVAKKLPDYRFEIYGFGPDVELIKELVTPVPNATFMGKTNDVAKVHQSAGIFLMTSDNEGLSIAVLESLSQATPVIIAKNSFAMAKTIINNNQNGFLSELFDVDETVENIRKIENNYEQFSTNSLRSFSKYDKENFKREWDNIFNSIN